MEDPGLAAWGLPELMAASALSHFGRLWLDVWSCQSSSLGAWGSVYYWMLIVYNFCNSVMLVGEVEPRPGGHHHIKNIDNLNLNIYTFFPFCFAHARIMIRNEGKFTCSDNWVKQQWWNDCGLWEFVTMWEAMWRLYQSRHHTVVSTYIISPQSVLHTRVNHTACAELTWRMFSVQHRYHKSKLQMLVCVRKVWVVIASFVNKLYLSLVMTLIMTKKYSQTWFIVLSCHDTYAGDTTRSSFTRHKAFKIRVTLTLTFQGHSRSNVKVPLDSPYTITH